MHIYTHTHKRAAGINKIAEPDASAAVNPAFFSCVHATLFANIFVSCLVGRSVGWSVGRMEPFTRPLTHLLAHAFAPEFMGNELNVSFSYDFDS